MRLYHFSIEKYLMLTPQFGAHRHGGEGANAAGEPVIWLANEPDSVMRNSKQTVLRFRHAVEVEDDDPCLRIDEKFEQDMKAIEKVYKKPVGLLWYVYTKPLAVVEIAVYDPQTNSFPPVTDAT